MKLLPILYAIGFIHRDGGVDAFSVSSLPSSAARCCYHLTDDAQSMHQRPRSRCTLHMKGDQSSSADDKMSRRSALRQFGSFCLSAIASTQIQPQQAQAASFSDSPILNSVPREVVKSGPTPLQFSDNNVVVSSNGPVSVPSSSASQPVTTTEATSEPAIAATQVKIENSQPTVQETETKSTPSVSTPSPKTTTTTERISIDSLKQGAMPEIALASFLVGSIFYTFNGRTIVDNTGSPKIKVVIDQPEPYGMDVGRRYWKGVDVSGNPILPADVREVCDAGAVTNECAESITDFLDEISSEQKGADVSEEQVEKATVVASYLDSLSSNSVNGSQAGTTNTATSKAFYSYLNELSAGNLPAPTSATSVANYLDALDVKGGDSLDGYQQARRLSAIETKMDQLEEKVDMLPTEIATKMQEWQQGQDIRLTNEIRKITSFLIKDDQQQQANGEAEPELVQKMTLPY